MKIYKYDKTTKEFIGDGTAQISPLEKDKYLIPSNATTVVPLQAKKGFAIVWNSEAWEYLEDNRGITVYQKDSKEKKEIKELGEIEDIYTKLKPKEYSTFQNGKWVVDRVLELNSLKIAKLQEINTKFDSKAGALKQDVPQDEVLSWDIQRLEALAFQKDNSVATPNVDLLATARGVPRELLLTKILEKVTAYSNSVFTLMGKRQRLEDLIKVATTKEQLALIFWEDVSEESEND